MAMARSALSLKVALTVLAASIVRLHEAAFPVQPPLQPVNVEPAAAISETVTTVPGLYSSAQSDPQLMPSGLLLTVPLPEPSLLTAREAFAGVLVAMAPGVRRTVAVAVKKSADVLVAVAVAVGVIVGEGIGVLVAPPAVGVGVGVPAIEPATAAAALIRPYVQRLPVPDT